MKGQHDMSRTDSHRPYQYLPTTPPDHEMGRYFWRDRKDAAELRTLRKREKRQEAAMLRNTALDYDAVVWPAYRPAAPWQLPTY